ncbi:alpha/beta hydrolase [Mycolicibacter kumamotonensis]|uniref:Alpha/beta hydrolase n=1 Tax=Mycolicibacter kumamotonensis TaxID=354243 RepID=A0A1B8SBT1_9MYCO|nr:alpha/beta hydrolase [Mycolicibacter kumamotonensis]NDJ90600.1 alpha/beta hydrolase [Mycolicibacter kumamotonensis]OBY30208.1 esterase [Mycolicibacter kumamotonensis]ORA77049.1 esterase [Mycolicibacter kumamotonensis]
MTAAPQTRETGWNLTGRLRWLRRARPADYLLAFSVASASLPVVGKRLEPLGGMTAMGVWGTRHMPEFVSSAAKSWLTPGAATVRKREREQTRAVSEAALRGVVAAADLDIDWPQPEQAPPVWKAWQHRRHIHRSGVRYGHDPAQVLDVWAPRELPTTPAPVLIYVPGGAWVHGSRTLQGYALLSHLAERGWVCLSIDYRVAPHNRWPRHIVDVKTAIAWAHANVDKFGGDRNFVAVAGASAGGHLAALAGLTGSDRGDRDYADQLPDGADTSVDAVVGIYGRYDWQDRSTPERVAFVDFLERVVVGRSIRRHRDLYRKASPIARVHSGAPPFLVVHGSADTVIPVAQARDFADRLRAVSHSKVGYLELPGAGHGFDMTDGARTGAVSTAIGLFLNQIHRDHTTIGSKQVI